MDGGWRGETRGRRSFLGRWETISGMTGLMWAAQSGMRWPKK